MLPASNFLEESVVSAIGPLPILSLATQPKKELNTTDDKVNRYVVLSYILKGFAVAAVGAGIVLAVTVGLPYGLVALTSLVFWGCALLLSKKEVVNDTKVKIPFPEGQPIGIKKGAGAESWLTSMLQFVTHIPRYHQAIQNEPSGLTVCLKEYLKAYDEAVKGKRSVVSCQTDTIREKMRETLQKISSATHPLEHDPYTALKCIHDSLNGENRKSCTIQFEDKGRIDLYLNVDNLGLEVSMESLFNSWFNDFFAGDDPSKTHRLLEMPRDFIVSFARLQCNEKGDVTGYLPITIKGPMECTLRKGYVASNVPDQAFECDAFISTLFGGPLVLQSVAYLKKGAQWWKCDGESVTQVTDVAIATEMQKAYMCHYTKKG
jgi:hypothetical protein